MLWRTKIKYALGGCFPDDVGWKNPQGFERWPPLGWGNMSFWLASGTQSWGWEKELGPWQTCMEAVPFPCQWGLVQGVTSDSWSSYARACQDLWWSFTRCPSAKSTHLYFSSVFSWVGPCGNWPGVDFRWLRALAERREQASGNWLSAHAMFWGTLSLVLLHFNSLMSLFCPKHTGKGNRLVSGRSKCSTLT